MCCVRELIAAAILENLDAIAERCRAKGAVVEVFVMDVRKEKEIADIVLGFDTRHVVDLVVANAGISAAMVGTTDPDRCLASLTRLS